MKKLLFAFGIFLIVLGLGLQLFFLRGTKGQALRPNELRSNIAYNDVPTLLIPGWGGNGWTYSKLIKHYQAENIAQKTMTIHVSPTGKVKVKGTVAHKKNALIQLIFDWNYTKDYVPQTKWLKKTITLLHERYHVDKLNIIAHSWGGSAFVHAVADSKILQKQVAYPKVILLGTPIDESFDENISYRQAQKQGSNDENYKQLVKKFKRFAPQSNITFYNLMGAVAGEKTDGSVPNIQSKFLQKLLRPAWSKYYQAVYQGIDHTGLHQNVRVLDTMDKILWNKKTIALKEQQ